MSSNLFSTTNKGGFSFNFPTTSANPASTTSAGPLFSFTSTVAKTTANAGQPAVTTASIFSSGFPSNFGKQPTASATAAVAPSFMTPAVPSFGVKPAATSAVSTIGVFTGFGAVTTTPASSLFGQSAFAAAAPATSAVVAPATTTTTGVFSSGFSSTFGKLPITSAPAGTAPTFMTPAVSGFGIKPEATSALSTIGAFSGFGTVTTTPASSFFGQSAFSVTTPTTSTVVAPAMTTTAGAFSSGFPSTFGKPLYTSTTVGTAPTFMTPAVPGFSIKPATTTSAASTTGAFSGFGTVTTTPVSSLFGQSAFSAAAPSIAAMVAPATTTTTGAFSSGFSSTFGKPPTTSATAATAPNNTAPTLFGLPAQIATPANTTAASVSSGAPTLFGLSIPKTSPASTTTVAPLIAAVSSPASTTLLKTPVVTTTTPALTAAVPAVPASTTTIPALKPLNYEQLESLINNWTLDVEEQEKIFLTQAAQINAWDRILMENGDKILELNDVLTNLESEDLRIDHELDFVDQQQQELNQILDQLEKAVSAESGESALAAGGSSSAFYGDKQREQMIQLQVQLDNQLKQMDDDLSQVLERVNTFTENEPSDDPLRQIAQVLGKQMDALQWIDEQTSQMQMRVGDTKKEIDTHRRQVPQPPPSFRTYQNKIF